ncbi:MAG: amino acid adenylation domain-containing protein [Burkholderiaceae bacterium]
MLELLNGQAAAKGSCLAYAMLDSQLDMAESLSFEQVARSARQLAGLLRQHSQPGDRVLLAMDNGLEAVQLFWACLAARLVPVPAPSPDNRHSGQALRRLEGIIRDAQVSQAWASAGLLEEARAHLPRVRWSALNCTQGEDVQGVQDTQDAQTAVTPDACAYLQYTSGSTSQPRGVAITHAQALAQCRALGDAAPLDPAHARSLTWLPWFHDYGLVHGLLQPMAMGVTSFIMPTVRFLLNPLKWLEAIDRHRITHSGAPDFAYAACVSALARKREWSAHLGSWFLATCGAEPVRHATLQAFADAFEPFGFDRCALTPSYGLAEAVLGVTMRRHRTPPLAIRVDTEALARGQILELATPGPTDARSLVGCGPAMPGFDVRIVNPDTREECPANRVGEIWVAGASVGQGYWQQDELTRSTFQGALAGSSGSERQYLKTGDLGFMAHGELFVTGRRKDLIVVHGRNLYPQDLEHTTQTAHPGVRTGGVVATSIEGASGETIVLLVECTGRPTSGQTQALIDTVKQRVEHEHEVGLREVVPLRTGSLPRTSSGKLMRNKARQMYLEGELDDRRHACAPSPTDTPSNTTMAEAWHQQVRDIWCEVLGACPALPEDDFLDQGGDSLMATQLVSRISTRLGMDLSIGMVFEARTLGRLIEKLTQIRGHALSLAPAAAPQALHIEEDAPGALSFSQERMWFMHQIAPESSAYHIPLAIRLRGTVDAQAMRQALRQAVQRHDILRTTFVATADRVQAQVSDIADTPLAEVDLRGDATTLPNRLRAHLTALSQRPFDIARGPLLRAELIRTGPEEAVLAIVMHHLVSDQWSCAILGRELASGYSSATGHPGKALPVPAMRYADYARWHRAWFNGFRRQRELAYWSQRLADLEPLTLNQDHDRPRQPSFRGASVRLSMSHADFATLSALGAAHGASLSMVLLATFNVLLGRHARQTDIAIGVPVANRNQLTSENLIGTFVNTLVLRTDLSGEPSFLDVLNQVRELSLEAFAHQDMPFELLVRELGLRHDSSRPPLFSVMFNMVNAPARDICFHGLEWSRIDFDRQATQFDLSLLVDPQHDPGIVFEYATDLFQRATIERMATHFEAILRTVVQQPAVGIHAIDLLTAGEQQQLQDWSAGPALHETLPNVGAWLARGAQRRPGHTALVVDGHPVSHGDLDAASSALADRLRRHGMGPGISVGVCIPRSVELILALTGLLRAGAAYVPLDPAYPDERLSYQVEDAGIRLLLATRATATLASQLYQGPIWILDDPGQDAGNGQPPGDRPRPAIPQSTDPAYLIYTSGSTGRPKGVVISHGAVLNFLASMAREPGLSADDRLLAVTTVSFDIAVLELLLPLGCGATVILASESQAMDGRELRDLLDRHAVTVMQATPSRWHLLLDADWRGAPGFKALVGGEPLTPSLAGELQSRCAQVWNMYGPTETTVWSTCWRVDTSAASGISLGHPVANTTIHILDDRLQPCPIGVMGEICIGGHGLALGYHQRPALNGEKFVTLEDADGGAGRRIYRTGDHGRWRGDGSLEHGGRMDDQVKLRGFRIELGEIEARLASLPNVQRAVTALKELPGHGQTLVAYLVCDGDAPSMEDIRQHLLPWLPAHMIPTHRVVIGQIPLLSNGKTDRKALPLPTAETVSLRTLDMPRDNAEQLVWAAWTEVLGTRDIGIHDSFFDVGGHSMLAVRLAARLEHDLARPVPLGTLFTHTTVADCAAALTEQADVPDLPVAVLQPAGEGPALFLLAGADMYRALARQLSPEYPVVGLFSQTEIDLLSLAADEHQPRISVHTLAQEYLALIRSVQPHGPYLLGGFSIGGVIAHEVTRLLREQGEAIGLLAMLDCALPGRGLGHLAKGISRRIRQVRLQGWRHLLHAAQVLEQERSRRDEPGQRRIRAYARAIREHTAVQGEMPALFLQAGDDPSTHPAYGWGDLIPGLVIERVPGRHMDILDPPNVAVLAARLKHRLSQTRPSATPMSVEALAGFMDETTTTATPGP